MRVCVVGAGASGLVAAKELIAEGHDVVVVERRSGLGGLFNIGLGPAGKGEAGGTTIYKGAYLTISAGVMEFSDFPGPYLAGGIRPTWSHAEYQAYLEQYTAHFGISQKIRFNTSVDKCVKLEGGRWAVAFTTAAGEQSTEQFDALAVCSGTHQSPKMPQWAQPSQSAAFGGEIRHSFNYVDAADLAGKRVVCIGLGESGADISREISDVAAEATLVLRSWPVLLERQPDGNPVASDSRTARLHHVHSLSSFCSWVGLPLLVIGAAGYVYSATYKLFCSLTGKQFSTSTYQLPIDEAPVDSFGQTRKAGFAYADKNSEWDDKLKAEFRKWDLRTPHTAFSKFATKNISFLPNVVKGKLQVCGPEKGGVSHLEAGVVVLKDGTRIPADVIMCCTGYKDEIKFIEGWALRDGDVRTLYKHAFDVDLGPSCCFIGWNRPSTGGIPACSEMVARYFAAICSGKAALPADMAARIERERATDDATFNGSPEIRTVVAYVPFMDGLAELIGCKPHLSHYLLRPRLLTKLLIGSCIPAQYRLRGPGATTEQAERQILQTAGGWTACAPGFYPRAVSFIFAYWLGLNEGDFRAAAKRGLVTTSGAA